MKRVAVALFDGAEELDWAGPWEVLSFWTRSWPEDGWETVTVARSRDPVTCAKGLRVLADRTWGDLGEVDLLVYPGGRGTRPQLEDGEVLDRLRVMSDRGTVLASVCTGSLVLAAAGLLRGRPATSHHASLDRLAKLDPTIDIRPDDRFVDDGEVLTAAGVSAGIDLALHLVARLAGEARARAVRRGIQYDPAPPV